MKLPLSLIVTFVIWLTLYQVAIAGFNTEEEARRGRRRRRLREARRRSLCLTHFEMGLFYIPLWLTHFEMVQCKAFSFLPLFALENMKKGCIRGEQV